MNSSDVTLDRLSNQLIAPPSPSGSPEDVLTSLGAMQAQDYPAALWAIGLRCGPSTTKRDVEDAIAKRKISRTWLMRGTLHFASSGDVHWMLGLFGPRLIKTAALRDRHLGLSEDTIRRAEGLFGRALEAEGSLTRDEMYAVLEKGGVKISGLLGYHLLYRAAWDGLICFGAHQGKAPTFELLDRRIAERNDLSGERALAELSSRYFTSHGPATIKDFVWWSGLKVADAKAGVEGASRSIVAEEIGGKTYYAPKKTGRRGVVGPVVHLLPAFDEYLVAYSDRSAMLGNEDTQRALKSGKIFFTHSNGIFLPVVVADGEVIGIWKRRTEKGGLVLAISPFVKLSTERAEGIEGAAQRYAAFMETPVRVEL
jgi:hypothetical protein